MSEESSKKTNFFKSAFKSIKDLDKYEDFALEQPKDAFKYLLKLVAVFTIIIACFYSYKIVDSLNDIYSNLKTILPEFSYSAGVLQVNSDEPIIINEYENTFGKVIIDTTTESTETKKYEEELKNNTLGLLILKDRCVLSSNGTSGQVIYKYSDLVSSYGITEFTKQDIINYIDGMNIVSIYTSIYFTIFVYLFMIYFISMLLDVLILAVLAYMVARISRIRLKFAPSFNIAIHGVTLPVLLNLIYIIVNLFTGFNIKYFQFMYNTIGYIYVIVAVLMIKTDFINRQIELMKLAEEQEKVREELKKQEEEKQKEEKKENKNPEKENKESQEQKEKTSKRKKKTEGEEGTGANAPACQETGK